VTAVVRHFGVGLGAGDLAPHVAGAHFAEVHFVLHLGADLLEVLVGERHGKHSDNRGHGGQAHAEEGQSAERLRLALGSVFVEIGHFF
jgi:hypothetical protein